MNTDRVRVALVPPRRARNARLALVVVLMVALAGCDDASAPAPSHDDRVLIRSAPVTRPDTAQTFQLTSVTQAAERAQLAFQVSGELAERPVDIGTTVDAGTLLARLETAQLDPAATAADASVDRLKTQLANARQSTQRTERLVEQDAATRQQLDDARARRDGLAAQLAEARAQAKRAGRSADQQRLIAPIGGTVTDVFFEPGEFVAAGQPVVSISGTGGLEARFGVPEQLVSALTTGQPADLSLPLDDGRAVTGRLLRVARATTGPGQLFQAVVHIDDTPDITPGQSVVWHLKGPSQADLLVPLAAIARIGTARAAVVYVIRNGHAHRVAIVPGAIIDTRVRVRGALAAGEPVAVAGLSHLTDGQAVRLVGPPEDPDA